jgi:hypothetical protein
MTRDENKIEILKKVENGTLSVEEGSDLIGILENAEKLENQPEILDPLPPAEPVEKPKTSGCWKAAWSMVLFGGAVLTGFSAYWVYQAYHRSGMGWGFWLSWIPFVIGVMIMIGGVWLLEGPWMHVRIKSKDEGKDVKFVFSMPAPFRFASWVMRTFGRYMPPEVREKGVPEMLDEIGESLKRGDPFQVQVDDDKSGDKVEVFIG